MRSNDYMTENQENIQNYKWIHGQLKSHIILLNITKVCEEWKAYWNRVEEIMCRKLNVSRTTSYRVINRLWWPENGGKKRLRVNDGANDARSKWGSENLLYLPLFIVLMKWRDIVDQWRNTRHQIRWKGMADRHTPFGMEKIPLIWSARGSCEGHTDESNVRSAQNILDVNCHVPQSLDAPQSGNFEAHALNRD